MGSVRGTGKASADDDRAMEATTKDVDVEIFIARTLCLFKLGTRMRKADCVKSSNLINKLRKDAGGRMLTSVRDY